MRLALGPDRRRHARVVGVFVAICSIGRLKLFLDHRLKLDDKLELLDHLDHCRTCREAIYHLSRQRDLGYFVYKPYFGEGEVA